MVQRRPRCKYHGFGGQACQNIVNTMCFAGFHENVAKMWVLDPYHWGGGTGNTGHGTIYIYIYMFFFGPLGYQNHQVTSTTATRSSQERDIVKKELEVLQPGKRCFGDSDEWNELRACKQSCMWIWIRMKKEPTR